MSASQITAEFFGGPADGQVQALRGLVDENRFAQPAPPPWHEGSGPPPPPMQAAVYHLIRDEQSRLPSLTDDGRHRYRFAGMAAW